MPTIIDEFIVTLGLNPADFEKESKKFEQDLDKQKSDAVKRGKEMEGSAKKQREGFSALKGELLSVLAVFGGVAGIKSFVDSTIKSDAAVGRLSKSIGASTEEISAWQGILRGVGGTSEDAASDLTTLVTAFQQIQATGQSPLIPYLNALSPLGGPQLKDLQHPTEALLKLADAFHKLTPEQAAYYGRQMGLSAAMVTVLRDGRDATQKLLDKQRELGVVSGEAAKKSQELQKALADLKTEATAAGRSLLQTLAPALSAVIERTATWLRLMRGGISLQDFALSSPGPMAMMALAERGGPKPPAGTPRSPGAPRAPAGGRAPSGAKNNIANFDNTVKFFTDRGWSLPAARGMAAGLYAESRLDPKATLRDATGTTYGIGQWRGARQRELFRRYGPNPTLMQQLEFAQWELNNTHRAAGAAIYNAPDEKTALEAFIRKFEAPDEAGVQGDLRRGQAALATKQSVTPAGYSGASVTINNLNVHTQATDAQGIARGIIPALRRTVPQANLGLV